MQFLGIDVSKDKLDCAWLREPATNKVKTKSLTNNRTGYRKLVDWILAQTNEDPSAVHVTLEATGVYHEAVATYLFDSGFQVSVVNPARPKKFAEALAIVHKTDKKDSVMLAKFGCMTGPELWQPESMEIRELKGLIARLEALEKDLQREENRLEKAEVAQTSDIVMESLETMLTTLKCEKKRLEKEIDDHIDNFPDLKKNRELMESIPGVGPVISRVMLAVIGSRTFSCARQVSAYLGLIPKLKESGTLKGRTVLSKAGPARVRAKLYMAAVVSIRSNPDIKAQYQRLIGNGKTSMQAIGAAMRKLVQICFGVVKSQSEYRPQMT